MRWLIRKIAWSRVVRLTSEVVVRLGWRAEHRPASFVESLSRSVRLREIAVALGMDFPVWRLDDKVQGREFAQDLGLRVPELYAVGSVDDCVAAAFERGAVVIKPLQRHSSQGVVAVTRRDGGFFDHMRRRWIANGSLDEYVRSCQVGLDDVLMAEEFIIRPGTVDTLSIEWKFFCFAGETGLIIQGDRATHDNRRIFQYRLPTFEAVSAPWVRGYHQVRAMPDPLFPRELRAVAEMYSSAVQAAFARIDLYEDTRGPVFGEITPHPSAGFARINFLGRRLDRMLGEMWDRAEVRLAMGDLASER